MNFNALTALLGVIFLLSGIQTSAASESVPRQVHLIEESERLLASNIKFNRFDSLKLNAQEKVSESAIGEAVIIIITNQRIVGYGLHSGWKPMRLQAGERIISITAEDFAGLVVSNKRYLNFNGQTGLWGVRKRGVGE